MITFVENSQVIAYLIVAFLGGIVGTGELVSRYRDDPFRVLLSFPAFVYVALNALVAVAALAVITVLQLDFGLEPASSRPLQVLVAGFGAMAVFRSSFFNVRIGDRDVAIGPSGFLQIMLEAVDKAVDRKRAMVRAERASTLMRGVAFDRAHEALPAYCLALMQNLRRDEQEEFARQITALRSSGVDGQVKSLMLGLLIMNNMGPGVLGAGVDSLRNRIENKLPE